MAPAGAAPASPAGGGSSYGQIFRSTAFIGGASVITLVLGIVRTKVLAVLLGPAGVGLAGIYTTIIGVAGTLAGMGIGSSGVRQIAEAAGSGDRMRIARTVRTLRRVALVLGVAGAVLLAAFSAPVARLTFGDHSQAAAIAVLGVAVFLGAVWGGQTALIQGLRRVADLARLNVLGAVAGTVFGLPLIWWLGVDGIVPLLLVVPAAGLACSWWFARRVEVAPVVLTWRETAGEARALLGLGLAFMVSAVLGAVVAYGVRWLVLRELGLAAAGHYAAAFTLSGIYAGFILQAMGADFYPRLTAVAADAPTVNRLVNEQTEIALLLAVPGVLATLVFAPWVIQVFYAAGFDPAATVLQWQVLGILGRVISWPMGFILLARGRRGTFVWTELLFNAAHLVGVWFGLRWFGLAGAGIAFLVAYVAYGLVLVGVTRTETHFVWSPVNRRLLAWMLPVVALVFMVRREMPLAPALLTGAAVTLVASWFSLRGLVRRIPAHRLSRLGFLTRWV